MQTKIESFSDYKKNEYGPSAKVKLSNGDFVFINEEPGPLVGKTVEIEVNEKQNKAGTRTYKIGKIGKVYEATATTSNGNNNGAYKQITWDDYRKVAEAAHSLAIKLEPDADTVTVDREGGRIESVVDRSPARVGFVNNVMRAYAEGRFIVPKEEEDDIPPF
jgi:hypothetical protein